MSFFRALFFAPRLYFALSACVVFFVFGHVYPVLAFIAKMCLLTLAVFALLDFLMLFRLPDGVFARREMAGRFSNGDENPVTLYFENRHAFPVNLAIIDELPFQFQIRDADFRTSIPAGGQKTLRYHIRPVKRGEYHFGALNVYVAGPIGLVKKQYKFEAERAVAVYPSYLQMRKYTLLAVSNRLTEAGIKKIRRVGHSMEFDQIREYVPGDDYRTINWKATARRSELMVTQFQDEKSQQVYNVIDMGRTMKMPFAGMTLLDYAINSALVISNIAIRKEDKAGLLTFSDKMSAMVPAERKKTQMLKILEALYRQESQFPEPDFELLFATLSRKVTQRSLVLLYTNFESLSGMRRRLYYLRRLAHRHLVVAIFFENTELHSRLERRSDSIEEIYVKTIAEKFAFEKKQIVKELNQHGVHAILTPPNALSVITLNKYLEFKALGLI